MAKYTLSIVSAAAAATAAYAEIRSTAAQRLFIREMGFTTNAATASSVGLGRPATAGTATGAVTGLQGDPADVTPSATMAATWSAAPTAPTQFLRRFVAPATQGSGIIWFFDRGDLVVPVSSSLVLWNFGAGAGAALSFYAVWEE